MTPKKYYLVVRDGQVILQTSSIGYAVAARIKMLESKPDAVVEIIDKWRTNAPDQQ